MKNVLGSCLLVACLHAGTSDLAAQGFDLVTATQGVFVYNEVNEYGAGMSVYDFDGDGWDDLTFCLSADSIRLYKNNEGSFAAIPSILYTPGEAKQATWVDYDNDGHADLFVTQYLGGNMLLRNQGDFTFEDVTEYSQIDVLPGAETYGCAWGDYDRDGLLDVYVCNYNWLDGVTNSLMRNEGDGTFTDVSLDLDIDNMSLPSFQPVWIDYNHDGWPDLHIINDKVPTNAMYMNNGDGTFTDASTDSGLELSFEAMSNSVADYNNDGTLDIYMTNNSSGNYLMRNNGGGSFDNFTSIAELEVNMLSWGATWIDYDNNGWQDIYVATDFSLFANQNQFFVNNGDETFTQNNSLGFSTDTSPAYGTAKGDFNNDNFGDFVVTAATPYPAKLFQNQGIGGNAIKVSLEGTVSNRDAVGTWISTYVGEQIFTEYTSCGFGYLGQNSQHVIIAVGDSLSVDSLSLEWPSGLVEWYYDLPANDSYSFLEGATLSATIIPGTDQQICSQDTLELSVTESFMAYEWSNGDTTATTLPLVSGEYWVTGITEFGFEVPSDTISITIAEPITYSIQTDHPDCYGDETGIIVVTVAGDIEADSILFDFGGIGEFQSGLAAGLYGFSILDEQGCWYFDSMELQQPDSFGYAFEVSPVSCFEGQDGQFMYDAWGATPPYDIDWSAETFDSLSAGNFDLVFTDALGCVHEFEIDVPQPEEVIIDLTIEDAPEGGQGSAEVDISGGTEPYDILWSDGSSETSATLDPGAHSVWVVDANECSYFIEFEIEELVGIDELDSVEILVSPNPFHDFVNLNSDRNCFLTIYDLLGTKCLELTVIKGMNTFDLTQLADGCYLGVASSQGEVRTFRLIRTSK